jgi:allophanate hydrolase
MVRPSQERIEIAVCGAHLAGQPLNHELVERGAKLVRTARTARGYSFYVITQGAVAKPGLIFDGAGQGGIELEIWSLAPADFAAVVAEIPSPLGIGTIALADGGSVKGFLCEAYAAAGAENITSYGGWRAFRARSGAI